METNAISAEQLAEHPLLAVLLSVASTILFLLFVGALATWIWLGLRIQRGEPILPVQPWRPRVWGLLDLVFVFMTVIASQVASIQLARILLGMQITPKFSEEQLPLSAMALLGVGNLAAVVIVAAWIAVRHQASLEHLGFRSEKFVGQVKLGLIVALGSLPIVYLLMFVVSQGTNTEYDHPLITKMLENATLASFLIGSFSAVIAAPVAEEFLFRVILQGWLESIVHSWHGQAWFWGASESQREFARSAFGNDSTEGQTVTVSDNPYSAQFSNDVSPDWHATAALGAEMGELAREPILEGTASELNIKNVVPPLWPVFVSGTLFGFAHWGYGLSFIPLIALGIILGLLYRATHSIWPGLVVHLCLNLLSMLALALTIASKQAGLEL